MQAASSYVLDDQRRMSAARNYFAWQASLLTPHLGQRVVEVGCGIGNFTEFLVDRETVVSVDSDPDCLAELQERFARPNLHVVCTDATELRGLARFEPDSCVCVNVLEHVADDAGAIRAMASILPRGGKLALLVPAFPALYGPIDRNLGHFRRYRGRDIAALAQKGGFAITTTHYANFPGFFGWWLNARIFKRREQSPAQIRLFDRYVVPVMARLERVGAPPFGQSIVAILAKL
jgi:SAM-dependent methyltransferase